MSYGEAWAQSGLIAGYHLNGNSTDFSGGAYNGTDTAITYSQANGKFGQGAGFNGTTSVIKASGSFTQSGTVSLWAKPTNFTGSPVIFAGNQNTNDSNNYLQLYFSTSGNIQFYIPTNVPFLVSTSTVSTGVWSHIVFTSDSSTIKAYINGNPTTLTVSGGSNTGQWFGDITSINQFCIGALARGSQYYSGFAGALDEILVFNRALSAQEIRRRYAQGVGKLE